MADYYYLVSTLPLLQLKDAPGTTYDQFLQDCSMWLSAGEMKQVSNARIDIENISLEEVKNGMLWNWIVFENSIRNELVKIRAANVGTSPDSYLRKHIENDPSIVSLIRDVAKESSPYKAELSLLDVRWDFLSNSEVGHYFDVTALILYSLKLQLLARKELFHVEKGQKVFHIIYEGNKDEEERKYRENNGR